MTDFFTACQNRENEIIQETRKQLGDYQIEVKHRDGVYRYLECRNPDKGWERSFQISTAPHIVTILGRWCHAYTLEWEYDMLTDFLNTENPKFGFWAGVVKNRTKLLTRDTRIIYAFLDDYLDEWAYENNIEPDIIAECKYRVRADLDTRAPDLVGKLRDWDIWYTKNITVRPFHDLDYDVADWNVWTAEWIQVCELLRWTACKVTEMEATRGH